MSDESLGRGTQCHISYMQCLVLYELFRVGRVLHWSLPPFQHRNLIVANESSTRRRRRERRV